MSPSDLDDMVELLGFGLDGIAELFECRYEGVVNLSYSCNMHHSGETVGIDFVR